MRWDIKMKKCTKEYILGIPRVKKEKQTSKIEKKKHMLSQYIRINMN